MPVFKRIISLAALTLVVSSWGLESAHAAWVYEKTVGSSLVFKGPAEKPETLKTSVPSPLFIAVLSDPDSGTPYALYEGKTCPNCEAANTSVFLQRLDGKGKVTSFVYPGKIKDPKKGAIVFDGRLFYGHCLPNVKQGVVSHQREQVDRRGMQRSVVIAEPGPQYAYEVLMERRLPSVKTTVSLVKRKSCFEIPGRTRTVLRKPLDLTPRKGLDDAEEEEEFIEKTGPTAETSAE